MIVQALPSFVSFELFLAWESCVISNLKLWYSRTRTGIKADSEACDDGNLVAMDGCSQVCACVICTHDAVYLSYLFLCLILLFLNTNIKSVRRAAVLKWDGHAPAPLANLSSQLHVEMGSKRAQSNVTAVPSTAWDEDVA